MKTRIEVDEMGRFILILPEDVIEEYMVSDGDSVMLDFTDDTNLLVQF